jgi:hypothetical protein
LGRPFYRGALPGRLPHHAGLPGIHAGRPIVGGHIRDVYCCPVLATDLARIKFSVTVANQQLSYKKLKLWATLHKPTVEARTTCTPTSPRPNLCTTPYQTAVPTTSQPIAREVPCRLPSGVIRPRVLIQWMHLLLAGLHSPAHEVQHHSRTINPIPIKHLEQLFNLHHFGAGRPRWPALQLLWDLRDIISHKWLLFLLHVKPFLVPITCG